MLSCHPLIGESLEGMEQRPVVMADFDYESLLDRARENIPEEISSRSRWRLPAPQIMIEGSNTIFRNFNEVVSMMDRDDNHVYQYILNELGTSGSRDGPAPASKAAFRPNGSRGQLQIMSIPTSNAANARHPIPISSRRTEQPSSNAKPAVQLAQSSSDQVIFSVWVSSTVPFRRCSRTASNAP